jgi:MOSC domain-containing protein YiiM
MTDNFSTDERSSLDARLRETFGRGLFREPDGGLARILRRGSIKTDDEFRLLSDQLDDQEKAEELDKKQIAKINRMLTAYGESR